MKLAIGFILTIICHLPGFAQGLLGQTKQQVIEANKSCLALNNYQGAVVFNCMGVKQYYYFQGKDSTCDLYARDMYTKQVADTLQFLLANGFVKTETRYVEPFLVSKHNNHEKFPSQVYTNQSVQYCIMPVSLNGKTADMNAVIVMYKRKKQ